MQPIANAKQAFQVQPTTDLKPAYPVQPNEMFTWDGNILWLIVPVHATIRVIIIASVTTNRDSPPDNLASFVVDYWRLLSMYDC